MSKTLKTTHSHTKLTKNKARKNCKPIYLWPLKPEEALKAFMQVDPKKVKSKV
jgi:hypothetical protein